MQKAALQFRILARGAPVVPVSHASSVFCEGNALVTTLDTRRNGAAIATESDVGLHPVGESAAGPVGVTANSAASESRGGWLSRQRWWWNGSVRPRPSWDGADEEMRTLHLVRRSRRAAVWLTVGIATVSFVLSFTSLRELAAMSAWPGWPSWLWPLIIDGTIILATLGIVALAPYRAELWNRVFLWLVLSAAALVSVGGNSFHAWLSTGHLPPWMRMGSAGLACVPPVALLATTHILAILWRFNPEPPADPATELRDRALELAMDKMGRWEAAAAELQGQGYCRNEETGQVAHALRYLYDFTPKMSLRAVGSTPEVRLHHDKVGKIQDAARVVLGLARPGEN
jgi:hypothetical protein